MKITTFNYFLSSLLLCVFMSCTTLQAQALKTFILKGQIVDRIDDDLLIRKPTDHFSNVTEIIKVDQGIFTHRLEGEPGTVRYLVFDDEMQRGYFKPIHFFLDQDTIRFTLYPEDNMGENTIAGGNLNADFIAFNQQFAQLFETQYEELYAERDRLDSAGMYYSTAFMTLINSLNDADIDQKIVVYKQIEDMQKTGEDLTEEGQRLQQLVVALQHDAIEWRYKYIQDHPSEMAFTLLIEDVMFKKEDQVVLGKTAATYGQYAAIFPDHPYVETVGEMLLGVLGLTVGGQLIDFEAPDLRGVEHRLSDLLTEEIMLIDFWGSWCGPCIAKTRTMVPLFQEFKDSGFGVVGIAREFKSTSALEKALERESFDWLNLVDLDDNQGIWQKYGMSNAAGMILLASKDGIILAVNPTAEEVRQILETRLTKKGE